MIAALAPLWAALRSPGAIALGVALALGVGVYLLGRADGVDAVEAAHTERALEAEQNRSRIDADIINRSDVDLCVELGGLRHDCERALRGAAPAAKSQ